MSAEKLADILKSRLTKLADDFPDMTGAECAECLRMEADCMREVVIELAPALTRKLPNER